MPLDLYNIIGVFPKIFFDKVRERHHYRRYKIVKGLIDKSYDVLDIGCGKPCDSIPDGAFIKYLGRGIGMDIKPCSGFEFVKGSITKMPFKDKKFNTVVAMEVFEHLNDIDEIESALKGVKRVLKSHGIFIFSTPTNSFLSRLIWRCWEKSVGKLWKDTHKVEFNTKWWIEKLKIYFDQVEIRGYCGVSVLIKCSDIKT